MTVPTRSIPTRSNCAAAAVATSILLLAGGAAAKAPAFTDLQLADAVEDELSYDYAINHHALEVTATDGVVELKGNLPNLLAKQHAIEEAQSVRGVRAVVDRIDVLPFVELSDYAIKTNVNDALLFDTVTESWEVEAEVNDGTVTLTGTVDSHAEREVAEQVVAGVVGVRGIDNQLLISYDADRADTEIKEEIQRTLRWDALVDHPYIEVSVKDGHVELSGNVGSAAERDQALLDAWVAGVQSVDVSKLTVANWARNKFQRAKTPLVTDQELKSAVTAAIDADPRVNVSNIIVSALNGEVTLRGIVETRRAKQAAERDAQLTTGAWRVDNRLRVQAPDPDDKKLKQRIEKSILWDPYLSTREIVVSVDGNHVRLSGVVDNTFEKQHAEEVVSGMKGVQTLTNAVDVVNENTLLEFDPHSFGGVMYPYHHSWYNYAPIPKKSDSETREDINSELFWSPFVDSDDIRVYVDNGLATLAGVVDDWAEMNSAIENAFEGGAVGVDNELVIRKEKSE